MTKPKKGADKSAETSTTTESTELARGPSSAMLALFKGEHSPALSNLKRRNIPQLVKAVDKDGVNIPVGGVLSAVIIDVIKSPKASIKGSLLWLHIVRFEGDKPVATGIEITFPATGVIRQALAPGVTDEDQDKKQQKALAEMLKFKGYLLVAKRQPDRQDSRYKKTMTVWDVYLSESPVDIGVKPH